MSTAAAAAAAAGGPGLRGAGTYYVATRGPRTGFRGPHICSAAAAAAMRVFDLVLAPAATLAHGHRGCYCCCCCSSTLPPDTQRGSCRRSPPGHHGRRCDGNNNRHHHSRARPQRGSRSSTRLPRPRPRPGRRPCPIPTTRGCLASSAEEVRGGSPLPELGGGGGVDDRQQEGQSRRRSRAPSPGRQSQRVGAAHI